MKEKTRPLTRARGLARASVFRTSVEIALASVSVCAILVAQSASAQELTLPTIDVQGGPSTPLQETPQLGKTNTPVGNLPGSVQVVPTATVRQEGGTDLRDAIRNVSGIDEGGGSAFNFYDRFQIRGLDPRIYSDGFSDGDQLNGFPHSLNGVDHIEVLKGPGSALFGSGPPGGSINIVHAVPSATPGYGVSLQGGSFGTIFANAHATGPTLVPGVNYRIDGLAQHADGFRGLTSADYELRPVWTWTHLDHTTTVAFDLRHIERTPDLQGLPYFRSSPGLIATPLTSVPRDTRYYSPYSHGNQDLARATVADSWIVSEFLTVNNRFSYMHRDLDVMRNGDGGGVVGDALTGRSIRHQHDLNDDLTYQLEPVWTFKTGNIGHTLLTGFEAHEQWITTHRETAALPNIGNIFAPVVPDQSIAGLHFVPNFANDLRATYLGIYATDQIDVTDKWKIRAGVRQDYWNTNLTPEASIPGANANGVPLVAGVNQSRTDTPVSWNIGTLYHVLPGVSPYVGVSEGHLANFNSEAVTSGLNAPENSLQYEAGVKFEGLNGRATLTTAVFDTQRDNVQASLVVGSNNVVVFNSQRTEGFEADVLVEPVDKWKIIGNVTFQDAELTENPSQPAAVGKHPQGVPERIFNLWTSYDFSIGALDGFRVSGGVQARDLTYADALNTEAVPAYAIWDAAVGYYQPTWDVALGVKNLTDATYFVSANGTGGFVGDPRTFYVKADYHF
jgi:iron complex outermembrane receptor protein